ncbi:DMSO/TMAO reductase YedYZ heme-binding membrane subunit [Kitasatospora sp. MAA4]|uniref:ferric reductase-like transmembrane domain-containing protein n=1 Tax=Kitasatospora sp. MAA4 TaxID=3035093 RepID=UPI002476E18E|nr:ferric reductase-like transmembrane domain-containing protein [Kitasatospora sp. MAA4]MDH6133707.1 DMSO/TMAO reductase YedYZ heme-binding membrane subunit [Kitasatospora sp. MAA4]
MTQMSDTLPSIGAEGDLSSSLRARFGNALPVLAVVLLVAVLSLLAMRPAVAATPIPGSPLDAYDRQIPYDMGAHEIARLSAIISYTLMVATVVLGIVLRMRYFQRNVNRGTVYGAHMTIALSALIFGAVHGLTFTYQPVWDIDTARLLIPFTGGRQRVPVGLGILGLELAVAVGCSVWLQQRLGYRRWLRFHQLSYVAFGLIWLHIFTVHPEPRHLDLVAIGIAAGFLSCLLAFLIRALPSRSRLNQHSFPGERGAR